jgi:translin
MRTGSPSSAEPPPPGGPVPEPVLAEIESHLRQRELRREELYQQARRLRRLSQATVSHLHTGAASAAELATVRRLLTDLATTVRGEGRGDEPIALDALQEGVEACLLEAIVAGRPWPAPADLGVDPEPYLLGLGDVVGEVRRLVLAALGRDDLPSAERHLLLMERLTDTLLRFDTARAIVQLKPKQDVARTLLERTRGEVVMARLLVRARSSPEGLR